jgi:hypothetical protein
VKKGIGALLATLLLAGVATAAPRKPLLKLVSTSDPMIVKGTGFKVKEKVRVTLTVPSPKTTLKRNVVATRTGSFKAVMGLVQTGRCGFNLRAVGSRGSVATLKSPPLPACMP